jgi:hypothetical protein
MAVTGTDIRDTGVTTSIGGTAAIIATIVGTMAIEASMVGTADIAAAITGGTAVIGATVTVGAVTEDIAGIADTKQDCRRKADDALAFRLFTRRSRCSETGTCPRFHSETRFFFARFAPQARR